MSPTSRQRFHLREALRFVECVAGVYVRRRELQRDAILRASFMTFVIVNVMYVPAMRHTAPMQFVLIFYSAVALTRGSRIA
jgi:hypothetical protein